MGRCLNPKRIRRPLWSGSKLVEELNADVWGFHLFLFLMILLIWRGHHKSQTTNLSQSITLCSVRRETTFLMNEWEEGIRPAHPRSSPFFLALFYCQFSRICCNRGKLQLPGSALAGWVNQSNWMGEPSLALEFSVSKPFGHFSQQLYHYYKWYFDLHLHCFCIYFSVGPEL